MKEYYVITNQNGMISLEEKSTPKRDPPSQENRERKKLLKQEISKNPKFESFLKENKVYGRFISNFMNEHKNCSSDRFKIRLNGLNKPEPINFCLSWDNTREGFSFWQVLNYRYYINQ